MATKNLNQEMIGLLQDLLETKFQLLLTSTAPHDRPFALRAVTKIYETIIEHNTKPKTNQPSYKTGKEVREISSEDDLKVKQDKELKAEEDIFLEKIQKQRDVCNEGIINSMCRELQNTFEQLLHQHVQERRMCSRYWNKKNAETRAIDKNAKKYIWDDSDDEDSESDSDDDKVATTTTPFTEEDYEDTLRNLLQEKCQNFLRVLKNIDASNTSAANEKARQIFLVQEKLTEIESADDVIQAEQLTKREELELKDLTMDELKEQQEKQLRVLEDGCIRKVLESGVFETKHNDTKHVNLVQTYLKNIQSLCRKHCLKETRIHKLLQRKQSNSEVNSDEEPEFDLETDWQFTDNRSVTH